MRRVTSRRSSESSPRLSTYICRQRVLENLRNLPHAPGVQMHHVPSKPLGRALGMKDGELSDPEDEVDVRIRSECPRFLIRRLSLIDADLVRKRQLNGISNSSSDSETDDEPSRPARSRRQGGAVARRKPKRPVTPVSESMDDDPCGVRRKRTFFKSVAETTVISPINGLFGGLNGVKAKGPISMGLGGGLNVAEVWRDAVSRGGSPVSVA